MKTFPKITGFLLIAGVAIGGACSKKKSKTVSQGLTAVTEATDDTRLSSPVLTSALAINSIDILGASLVSDGAGLRLAEPSDYEKDTRRVNVYDPAMEGLTQAGSILCFFNQANYIEMVNAGPYLAQADMDTCFNEGGGSEQGQSSGSTKNLMTLTVDSTRTDDLAPLIVKAWFTMMDGGSNSEVAMSIKMVITEGQSEQNPLGIFRLTWEGASEVDTGANRGYIAISRSSADGKIRLNMLDSYPEQDGSTTESATAAELAYDAASESITAGALKTSAPVWMEDGPVNVNYSAAFNSTHFARQAEGEDSVCLAKNEHDYNVWRYGLYSVADGSRIKRASGFPIFVESEGKKVYGWAGYWGVHLPEHIEITNGMAVKKIDHATGATSDYSVKVGPGKLLKRTKKSITLTELVGVELEAHGDQGPMIVSWDGSKFQKVGTRGQDGQIQAASGEYALASGRGAHAVNNMHSQALGGQVVIYSSDAGVPETTAYYFKEENVSASAAKITLYCYQQCLKGNITAAQANADSFDHTANSAMFSVDYSQLDWSDPAAAAASMQKTYEYDPATMTLNLVSGSTRTPVRIADNQDLSNYQGWGFHSGALVTTQLQNPWNAYEQDVYYTWETGPKSWNKFIALKDSAGAYVTFEAPLFLDYVHSAENDRVGSSDFDKFYGKKFLMNYEGFGELRGIPSGPDASGRWTAAFTLKDGVVIGTDYKVKALDMEMKMREKAAAECAGLSLDSSIVLPDASSYVSPNIGTAPEVTAAPAVVEGVLQ